MRLHVVLAHVLAKISRFVDVVPNESFLRPVRDRERNRGADEPFGLQRLTIGADSADRARNVQRSADLVIRVLEILLIIALDEARHAASVAEDR